jgi:hypothetical protein
VGSHPVSDFSILIGVEVVESDPLRASPTGIDQRPVTPYTGPGRRGIISLPHFVLDAEVAWCGVKDLTGEVPLSPAQSSALKTGNPASGYP